MLRAIRNIFVLPMWGHWILDNIGMNLLATFWKTSWKDFHTRLGRTHFNPDRVWNQRRAGDCVHQGVVNVPRAHYTRDRETPIGKVGEGWQAIKKQGCKQQVKLNAKLSAN